MKIKYLLSGRLLTDVSHCRRLIDSWPLDIPFPDVVEDIKRIKDNDIVFTKGYLGQSAKLIRNHNPQNIFIFDNAIFPTKGISNFRILNGNLDSLINFLFLDLIKLYTSTSGCSKIKSVSIPFCKSNLYIELLSLCLFEETYISLLSNVKNKGDTDSLKFVVKIS